MKGLRPPTFKGVDLPKFDAFMANSAKLDSLAFSSAKLDSFTANFSKFDVRSLSAGECTPNFASYEPDYFKAFQRASSPLKQGQRDWLAKGLGAWNLYITNALARVAVEVKAHPNYGVFDLRTFLHRRQVLGMLRRARWARRSRRAAVRTWLLEVGDALLSRVAARLRNVSVPKVLLAILKSPPGWTTAVRFRIDLETSIPRILEQLAEVIAPNAPSGLDPSRQFLIEAGAVQSH